MPPRDCARHPDPGLARVIFHALTEGCEPPFGFAAAEGKRAAASAGHSSGPLETCALSGAPRLRSWTAGDQVGLELARARRPTRRGISEYGSGIGTFTGEILRRMRRDAQLVAIETNRDFVRFLQGLRRIRDCTSCTTPPQKCSRS